MCALEVGVVDGCRGDRVRSCVGGVDGSGSATSGKYAGFDGVRSESVVACVVLVRLVMEGRAG